MQEEINDTFDILGVERHISLGSFSSLAHGLEPGLGLTPRRQTAPGPTSPNDGRVEHNMWFAPAASKVSIRVVLSRR